MRYPLLVVRLLLVTGLLLTSLTPAGAPVAQGLAAMTVTSTPTPAPTATPAPVTGPGQLTPAAMDERSTALASLLTDLRSENDLTRVDLDELGFALGGDADDIVNWVREHINFQQYPGLLRGAQGTLATRAGNALDQALLLARLLGDAGYEIRIARGELDAVQAETLLRQIAILRTPPPAPDQAALDATLVEIGALYGIDEADMLAQIASDAATVPLTTTAPYQAAQAQTVSILTQLDKAGLELGSAGAYDDLVAEARDYFWVEYRLSPAEPWIAAQPVFADDAAVPVDLTATAVYTQSIPDDLVQRVRIRVLVEQKQDDQLREQEVMPVWEQPAADLRGKPLTFQLYPDGLSAAADLVDIDKLIDSTTFYLPVLDGAVVPEGSAFDLNGNLLAVGLLEQSLGMGAVGSSMGDALEGAIGAFDSVDDAAAQPSSSPTPTPAPSDLIALTGAWIEYSLIAPGGAETTTRRTILDRIGAENRAQGKIAIAPGMDFPAAARALLTSHTVVVLPGDYTPAYVADRLLARMIDELALAPHVASQAADAAALPDDLDQALRELPRMEDVTLTTAFAPGAQVDPALITWRPAPLLAVVDRGFLPDQRDMGFSRVDIVANPRRALRVESDELRWAPADALQVGVWETFMEGAPLPDIGDTQFNTQIAFDWARQQAIPVQVFGPADAGAVQKLRLDAETLANLARDLADGFIVVTPTRMLSGQQQIAWWRIDPATGAALGVGSDGRGQTIDEYAITLKSVLLSAGLSTPGTIYSYNKCVSGGGSAGCCAAVNGATFAGGMLLGFGVTKVLGGLVSLISTDILLNAAQIGATATGLPFPLPNICS